MRIAAIWLESSPDRNGISTAYTIVSLVSFVAILTIPAGPVPVLLEGRIFVTGLRRVVIHRIGHRRESRLRHGAEGQDR